MGQTVLSLDQNLLKRLEKALQIKKRKKNHMKDNIGQIVLPLI